MSLVLKETGEQTQSRSGSKLKDTGQRLTGWLDERLGFSGPIRRFLTYPVPGYVHKNLLYSLGGLSLISFLLQIATGFLLSFYYDPSLEGAYNSVDYVTYQASLGWLIRGLHYYNASAIVILISLHLLRTFSFSAYKKPREITWLSGILLLLVTLGFAFTGYLLPWDQKGYWATKVGTEIAGSAPLIGEWSLRLIRGGPELGQVTLTRFYVIHVLLLPAALVVLIGLHIQQLRRHGIAPPITQRARALAHKFVPFFPHWVVIDAGLGLILLAALIFLSWNYRAPLEFPADPSSTDFLPRPEWYFLFLFQMLKYFPGLWEPIAAFLIPLLVIGSMLALPFIDRGEERRPWRKPITSAVAVFYVVMIISLTLLAWQADQETQAVVDQPPAPPAVPVVAAKPEVEVGTEAEVEAGAEIEAKIEVEAEAMVETEPEAEIVTEIKTGPEVEPDIAVEAEVRPAASLPAALDPPSAALAPLSDEPNTLTAIQAGAVTLDSNAEFWANAPRLEVATQGAKAALSGSDQKTGPVVTVQAAYDANTLVIRIEWPDPTESILRSAWNWDGSRFVKRGNEDQVVFLWPLGNNPEFSTKGCAAACHQATADEDWWMGSESDSIRYDVWQWLAARTNPVGQADDEWWGPLTDPNNPDSSRHGDAAESGGYQDNLATDKRGPAFMHQADLSTPFILAGQEAPVDTSRLSPNTIVPGYILAPFTGSRGDVSGQGTWVEGKWVVVLQRVLDTGYDDDAVFIPGKRLPFGLAVMDNKNGINHTVAPEVLILEWQ
jgi:ubiquinol-cytochrome c reductase cytochrome b subunit